MRHLPDPAREQLDAGLGRRDGYGARRLPAQQRDAKFDVLDTEWGTSYGVYRPAEDDTYYWRIAHQLFPFYAMVPTGVLGLEVRFRAYVPIDDDHTMMWTITGRNGMRPAREGLRATGAQ